MEFSQSISLPLRPFESKRFPLLPLFHFGPIHIPAKFSLYDRLVQASESLGDILANAITHGIGLAVAIAGSVWLITAASRGSTLCVVSCSIFATTLILVYLCSTLYHSLVLTPARRVFQILDHAAIYLLIAGTYTPFMLISLRGPLGWTILAFVWALAVAGIIFKSVTASAFSNPRLELISALVYLFQGWFIVIALFPLAHALGWHGMLWLGAGGMAYTLGIVFFAFDRLRYFHATWHLFVLAGSVAHFFAILYYVVPPRT